MYNNVVWFYTHI